MRCFVVISILAFILPAVDSFASPPGTLKKTSAGYEFRRVSEAELTDRGVTDPVAFGEAWEDPIGMIWGDIARKPTGTAKIISHHEATEYCRRLGARLPSGFPAGKTESDFVRLRRYLGGVGDPTSEEESGYRPQILPGLVFEENGHSYSEFNWSDSLVPKNPDFAYTFFSGAGVVYRAFRDNDGNYSVRCVVDPRRKRSYRLDETSTEDLVK